MTFKLLGQLPLNSGAQDALIFPQTFLEIFSKYKFKSESLSAKIWLSFEYWNTNLKKNNLKIKLKS